MTEQELEKAKHPIGPFVKPDKYTKDILEHYIYCLSTLPDRLKKETEHLTDEQLNTSYRPGGWTIRQLIHHLSDSHMNVFIRYKLTLTEEKPEIRPFDENKWAELPDTKTMPVEPGLQLIAGLHRRWAELLNSMTEEDFLKSFYHPEFGILYPLNEVTGTYAWHGDHHLAQIIELKKRKGWI